jgi:hypothetical protein
MPNPAEQIDEIRRIDELIAEAEHSKGSPGSDGYAIAVDNLRILRERRRAVMTEAYEISGSE